MLSWVLQVGLQQGDRWDPTDVVDTSMETRLSRPQSWNRDRSFQDGCRYLPPEIAQQDAEETQAREPLILKLLSSNLAENHWVAKPFLLGFMGSALNTTSCEQADAPPGPSLRASFSVNGRNAAPDLAHVLKTTDKDTKINIINSWKKHEQHQATSPTPSHTKETKPLRQFCDRRWSSSSPCVGVSLRLEMFEERGGTEDAHRPRGPWGATGWDKLDKPSILWGYLWNLHLGAQFHL